jgi:two-component sensor histidine kinase
VADITDRRRADEHRELLVNELNHRVKNTLAVVQALANRTFLQPGQADPRVDVYAGRLAALAHAHNLLSNEGWTKAYLADVARQTLPLAREAEERISVSGPPVILNPKQAVTLAMALHELYTNAVKYGSLSAASGSVDLSWQTLPERRLSLSWRERGGPQVSPPSRRGFGSTLIEQALVAEFDAAVRMDFRPEGLSCTMEAALPRQHG